MPQPKKILIVEDEPNLLELYRLALERDGFEVFTASNGEAGLMLVRGNAPDLVLLDILMPKVDGYEMLKRLKEDAKAKNIPVVIFSNLSQKEEIEKGLKLGAQDFIIKTSVTPREMVEKVKQWVKDM
ncbi:MAG: response regulator [Patescibacteria group bacterium]|nr:response regulator [Patescibacteria group bacterium]